MPKVMLKRNWFVGGNLYEKNVEGTEIPQDILDENKLPQGAVLLSADFVAPVAQPTDYKTDVGAKAEAEFLNNAEKAYAGYRQRKQMPKPEPEAEPAPEKVEKPLVERSTKEILAKLPELSSADLRVLLEAERAGKGRSSLIVEIEAAIEDLSNKPAQA